MRRPALLLLPATVLAAATAHAAPPAVETVLCQRQDDRFTDEHQPYVTVAPAPTPVATAKRDDDKHAYTVCQNGAKACQQFVGPDSTYEFALSANGKWLAIGGERGVAIVDAATGKTKHVLKNKRGKGYTCGAGVFLGDLLVGFGNDCSEFDALPFVANARTGVYLGALGGKNAGANGETLYDVAALGDAHWAVAMYDHYNGGHTTVFVVDAKTGSAKVAAEAEPGKLELIEGKHRRAVTDKLAACPK